MTIPGNAEPTALSNEQREQLCEMIFHALVDIRALAWNGKAEQAADLADAFHNLPVVIWQPGFSCRYFRDYLLRYLQRCSEEKRQHFNYIEMLDQITGLPE
jgi:hypothetical protein